jgi:acyl transferase domain-containing protein
VGSCRGAASTWRATTYSDAKRLGTVDVKYGFFLDEVVDPAGVDTSLTAMGRSELEMLDRLLLEAVREALEDASTTRVAGSATSVYIGSFGEHWHYILRREKLQSMQFFFFAIFAETNIEKERFHNLVYK